MTSLSLLHSLLVAASTSTLTQIVTSTMTVTEIKTCTVAIEATNVPLPPKEQQPVLLSGMHAKTVCKKGNLKLE